MKRKKEDLIAEEEERIENQKVIRGHREGGFGDYEDQLV